MSEVQTEEDYKLNTKILYIVGGCFCMLVLSMTTCTMHSNAYEADVEAQLVKKAQVNAEAEKMRIKALQELIDKGADPFTARCAIEGWDNQSEAVLCQQK